MFCPKCGREYRDEFDNCPDCDEILEKDPSVRERKKPLEINYLKYAVLLQIFAESLTFFIILSGTVFVEYFAIKSVAQTGSILLLLSAVFHVNFAQTIRTDFIKPGSAALRLSGIFLLVAYIAVLILRVKKLMRVFIDKLPADLAQDITHRTEFENLVPLILTVAVMVFFWNLYSNRNNTAFTKLVNPIRLALYGSVIHFGVQASGLMLLRN